MSDNHAINEFSILEKTDPDAIILEFKPEIIALYNAFANSGQSGGSAPYVASMISSAIKKLMMYETISPLTGEDNEWNDISHYGNGNEPLFQNKRDSRVFKQGSNGRAYFIEAIVFNGSTGGRFTGYNSVSLGNEEGYIGSSQYIKSFPFTPKIFYIDVIDFRWKDKEETTPDENGDWWTHLITYPEQLIEVFEYYDKK
jgi:hypothetical protein